VRFAVESWAPEYGAPAELVGGDALDEADVPVDPWVEVAEAQWSPRAPAPTTAGVGCILFVDGVRRVEANVWIAGADGGARRGICASYAAGAVRCDGRATLVDARVRRGLFAVTGPASAPHGAGPSGAGASDAGLAPIVTTAGTFAVRPSASDDPDDLTLLLQRCMGDLEAEVASAAGPDVDLILVDGPLRSGMGDERSVGYVKTHRRTYGPPLVREVVAALAPGQRTPLLLIDARRARFTWYLRLPGELTHGWSGVVRVEVAATTTVAAASAHADEVSRALPWFASVPQKDPRAPQNLVPIGGLERELRRRLGDPALLYRALRRAARTWDV
jgi:hypothetical protein